MHDETARNFRTPGGQPFRLYQHQLEPLQQARPGASYVVNSGRRYRTWPMMPPASLSPMTQVPTATINLVCPKCMAVNRVPEVRMADRPVCGRCKTGLLPDHPIELSDANFEKFIAKSDLPIVVDFWASWCGPCRSMAPQFEQAARTLATQVLFAKLNTETNQVANQFQITGIPCLIAFARGREIARQAGLMNSSQIVHWVRSVGR